MVLRVLVSAYAVSPCWGSEPGMGWNWISNLARYCDLQIITEGEWRKEIEMSLSAALKGNFDDSVNPTRLTKEQAERMHFHYLPVSPEIRRMCWNQGTWRFYYYYAQWQKRCLVKAKEIIASTSIDVIHQLNMIGFREPGDLWKIENIPLVWGPIGGVGTYPKSFLKGESYNLKFKVYLKNILNYLSFRYLPRVRKCFKHSSSLVAATKQTLEAVQDYYHKEISLINETGCFANADNYPHPSNNELFKILWVGKYDYMKQLGIAIRTMGRLRHKQNIVLNVLGSGYEKDVKKYQNLVCELGLEASVKLLGSVPNVQVHKMMQESDLFFFTSIGDATSTVVPEAISSGLPVLCHDTCGFGPIVDDSIGRKVEVISPDYSIKNFAAIIEELESNRAEVRRLSTNCLSRRHEISWDSHARKMVEIYSKLVSS